MPMLGTLLKKMALSVATDPKILKKILGVLLVILIVIFTPVAAILAMFSGDIQIDQERLQEIVVEKLTAEEQEKLQAVEDTMIAIQEKMKAAGFNAQRTKEAQVLFTLALSTFADDSDFTNRLVSCFAEEQSDTQLIANINAEFGTEVKVEDFTNVMQAIRSSYIVTDGYVNPAVKNNIDLVTWAKQAKAAGWGYVWGTYGDVLTPALLDAKAKQYPEDLKDDLAFIQENWLGGRTADCVGLIKGYGWLDTETNEIVIGTNGMPDLGANDMYASATEKGPIGTLPEIPGLAVWHSGHIGIYIGEGKVIEANTTRVGVIETQLQSGRWTHWLKIPFIEYMDPEEKEEALYGK